MARYHLDREVSERRGKVFITNWAYADLKVEAVTKMVLAANMSEITNHPGGSRLIPLSLPRVRWLEKPLPPCMENENERVR